MPVSQPLASWSDGPTKSAILDFVACVTKQGGPEFAPPVERIATFDNDGTLCCEQPLQIQFHFAFDRVKELSAKDPAMAERPVFKAVLERDYNTPFGLGSSVKLRFDSEGGRASLTKVPEPTSSTTGRRSRRASACISAAGRCSRSGTRTAISR
jgi:hypothetical protein